MYFFVKLIFLVIQKAEREWDLPSSTSLLTKYSQWPMVGQAKSKDQDSILVFHMDGKEPGVASSLSAVQAHWQEAR